MKTESHKIWNQSIEPFQNNGQIGFDVTRLAHCNARFIYALCLASLMHDSGERQMKIFWPKMSSILRNEHGRYIKGVCASKAEFPRLKLH